jgi:Protein of unknown function (DUF3099)
MLPTYDGSMARTLRRHHDEPVRITTAASSPAADIAARQRRYVISMGIRTVCFVAAIVADGWLRWILIVAALLLPYVAVVMANSANTRSDGFLLRDGGSARPELTAAPRSEERRPPDGV